MKKRAKEQVRLEASPELSVEPALELSLSDGEFAAVFGGVDESISPVLTSNS